MNKRQVIILWVIALALGATVAVTKITQQQGADSATKRAVGETLFEAFPAAETATVSIDGAGESVTLAKTDGKWTVAERDQYPANTRYVNDFLRVLGELKVTQGLEAGPSFAPRFGIDEAASAPAEHGLIATFKDASGKQIAKVGLGKNIESKTGPSPMNPAGGGASVGRYLRNFADESGFYAVNEMFPSVSSEAARWLDTGFFSPEKIQSITLTQKDNDQTAWKVTREGEDAEFELEGVTAGEVLNTTNASPLKTLFSYARFDDIVPAAAVAERTAADGRQSAEIKTFEGFTYQLTLTPAKAGEDAEGTPPATEQYLVTVEVAAELPKQRKKEADEKEEDAQTKDAAFAERLKTLTGKLDQEKQLAGRTFVVAKSTVDPLLKERADLVTTAEAPQAGESPQATGSVQPMPGGLIATPPVQLPAPAKPRSKPVEAVTPPIAVPPLPAAEDNEPEPGE